MEGFIRTAPCFKWDGRRDTIHTDDYLSFVEAVGARITKLQQEIREEMRSLGITFLALLGCVLALAVFRHTPVDLPLLKLCTAIALLGTGVSEFIRWAYSGCYCTKKCLIGTRLLLFWRAEYARQNAADARITPEAT